MLVIFLYMEVLLFSNQKVPYKAFKVSKPTSYKNAQHQNQLRCWATEAPVLFVSINVFDQNNVTQTEDLMFSVTRPNEFAKTFSFFYFCLSFKGFFYFSLRFFLALYRGNMLEFYIHQKIFGHSYHLPKFLSFSLLIVFSPWVLIFFTLSFLKSQN